MKKISPKAKNIGMLIIPALVGAAALSLLVGQIHMADMQDAPDPGDTSASSASLVLAVPQPATDGSSSNGTSSAPASSPGTTSRKSPKAVPKPSHLLPKTTPPASLTPANQSKKPSCTSIPKNLPSKSPVKSSTSKNSDLKGKTNTPGPGGHVAGAGQGKGTTAGKPGDKSTEHKVGATVN